MGNTIYDGLIFLMEVLKTWIRLLFWLAATLAAVAVLFYVYAGVEALVKNPIIALVLVLTGVIAFIGTLDEYW